MVNYLDFNAEMQYNIACVIVTYNRKDLLKRCLDAVSVQTYKPSVVYIVDNASTDGTMDFVKHWGYHNRINNNIEFKYIQNSKNEGGAGGFYLGMKYAFEDKYYDALWVMDDDGEPAPNCLCELQKELYRYHYVAPLVVDDEDRISCSFTDSHEPYTEFSKKAVDGLIKDWSNPFNGILLSHELIERVGYPKKEMFIWGDEENYDYRCFLGGFSKVCVVDAIHFHPKDRQNRIIYKGVVIVPIESNWKLYCYIRNHMYNRVHFRTYLRKLAVRRFFYRVIELLKAWYILRITDEYYKMILKQNMTKVIYKAGIAGALGYFGGQS